MGLPPCVGLGNPEPAYDVYWVMPRPENVLSRCTFETRNPYQNRARLILGVQGRRTCQRCTVIRLYIVIPFRPQWVPSKTFSLTHAVPRRTIWDKLAKWRLSRRTALRHLATRKSCVCRRRWKFWTVISLLGSNSHCANIKHFFWWLLLGRCAYALVIRIGAVNPRKLSNDPKSICLNQCCGNATCFAKSLIGYIVRSRW